MVNRFGQRILQLRNPWSKRGIPKSTFSTTNNPLNTNQNDDNKITFEDDATVGTFWLDYINLSQTFKTLYVNWSPSIFTYCTQKQFSFTPNGSDFDIGQNGQYTFMAEGNGDIWILVERHYLGKSEAWEGYIGLAVFPGNERVYSYTRATYRVQIPLPPKFFVDV